MAVVFWLSRNPHFSFFLDPMYLFPAAYCLCGYLHSLSLDSEHSNEVQTQNSKEFSR